MVGFATLGPCNPPLFAAKLRMLPGCRLRHTVSVRHGKSRETAAQPRRRFLQPAVPEGLCGRVLAGCG